MGMNAKTFIDGKAIVSTSDPSQGLYLIRIDLRCAVQETIGLMTSYSSRASALYQRVVIASRLLLRRQA